MTHRWIIQKFREKVKRCTSIPLHRKIPSQFPCPSQLNCFKTSLVKVTGSAKFLEQVTIWQSYMGCYFTYYFYTSFSEILNLLSLWLCLNLTHFSPFCALNMHFGHWLTLLSYKAGGRWTNEKCMLHTFKRVPYSHSQTPTCTHIHTVPYTRTLNVRSLFSSEPNLFV